MLLGFINQGGHNEWESKLQQTISRSWQTSLEQESSMDGYESDTEDNTIAHHQALKEGQFDLSFNSFSAESLCPMRSDLHLCPADMEIEEQMAATDAPGREMSLTVSSSNVVYALPDTC